MVVVVVMASLHKISLGEDGMARERERKREYLVQRRQNVMVWNGEITIN